MKKTFKYFIVSIFAFIMCLSTVFSFGNSFSKILDFTFKNEKVIAEENLQNSAENNITTTADIPVSAVTYQDNKNYQNNVVSNNNIALGNSWLNLRINTNSKGMAIENKGNNVYVLDSTAGDGQSVLGNIVIEANYNYGTTTNIGNSGWNLSRDSAKNILGFSNLGVVGTGAFIVETSYDGQNYNEVKSALKTVNVTEALNPELYNAENGNYKVAYQPSGTDVNKGLYIRIRFAYEICKTIYNYFDHDLNMWFIESTVNPESSGHKYLLFGTTTTYYNILETANFYIANNSGVVGFHNLTNNIESIKENLLNNFVSNMYLKTVNTEGAILTDFEKKYQKYINGEKDEQGNDIVITKQEKLDYYNSNVDEENKLDDKKLTEIANQYYQAETLQDGDMTLSGFSLDNLGNNNYTVRYELDGVDKGQMKNGQLFLEQGRYDIYVSTPWKIDKEHYTIFVNPRAESATLTDYFDKNFITEDSKRVYDVESKVPVYVAGSINYQIKNDEGKVPLSGKITKYNDDETTSDVYTFLYDEPKNEVEGLVLLDRNANNTGSLDLEEGFYVATFYTTTDFTDGITGDYYTFTYVFEVIDSENIVGPIVNQSLLNAFANVSRYNSLYYGVEQTNINNKIVTFAFNTYESAFNFAYEIESNKVTYNQGQYSYNGNTYSNARLVAEAVNENVNNIVKTKYFDASDIYTFLTISDQVLNDFVNNSDITELGKDVLNLSYINEDIVVISNSQDIENFKTPVPFLNDGYNAILNSDGTINVEKTDLQFISVADYESKTIKAINMETEVEYDLAYNQNVEIQLISQKATSGKYKIVETNLCGDGSSDTSIYYAIYIAQENTSEVSITYLENGQTVNTVLNNIDNGKIINTDSLVIENITNDLDPYSIVKIVYEGNTDIMAIWELKNYKIQKQGNYQIYIVDRLGNVLKFVVNILNPVNSVILTYEDDSTQVAFVGVKTMLKDGLTKENYIFKGWTYQGLEAEYATSITPSTNEDLNLTSVWHHSIVNITWCDGDFVETTQAVPEDTIDFDTSKFYKEGFELVGFMWNHDGKNTFYTYRISSVPNVEEMSITAIYKKVSSQSVEPNGITLVDGDNVFENVEKGQRFPELDTIEGMTFIGWMKLGVEDGTIYNDVVPNLTEDAVLVAVYVKTPTDENAIIGNGFWNNFVSGITNFANTVVNGVASNINILLPTMMTLALMMLVIAKRERFVKLFKNGFANIKAKIQENNSTNIQSICNDIENNVEIENNCEIVKTVKLKNKKSKSCRRFNNKKSSWKFVTFATCMLFSLILGSQGILVSVARIKATQMLKTSIEQTAVVNQEELYQDLVETVETIKENEENINNEIANQEVVSEEIITQTAEDLTSKTENSNQFTMSDDEAFLYSNVLFDLTTLGYTVFPAKVRFDNQTIYGLGYTTGEQVYEKEDEEDVVYLGSGFTAFLNQTPITDYAIEQGLTILPLVDVEEGCDEDGQTEVKYILSFEESYIDQETNTILYNHYISNNQYVHYALYDFASHATFTPIIDWDSMEQIYDKSAGAVYSYDEELIVFDPSWQKDTISVEQLLANSISNSATLEQSKIFFESFVEMQDSNFLDIQTDTYIFYSTINLNEIYLQLQQETMLGITAEQWREVENQFNEGVYYYIVEKQETDENGNLLWLDENGEKTTTETGLPSMISDIEYSTYPKEPNGGLIAFGCIVIIGGLILSVFTGAIGAAVAAKLTSVAISATLKTIITLSVVFTVSAVSGFAMDIGSQLLINGIVGNSITDLNFTRTIVNGLFNGLTFSLGNIIKNTKIGWQVAKLAALSVLEGIANFAIAMIDGASLNEAFAEFGYGFALGLLTNAIDMASTLRSAKKAAQTTDLLDDGIRAISKSDIDDTAGDLLKNADNGIKQLDEDSIQYLKNKLPSEDKVQYIGLDNKTLTKAEFVANGGNGKIQINKEFQFVDAKGNLVTELDVKNGVVDFTPFSHDEVKIKNFGDRNQNFEQAYEALAKKWSDNRNAIPKSIKDYLNKHELENIIIDKNFVKDVCSGIEIPNVRYTLHETVEKTVMLIPTNIHQKIKHFGGIALYGNKKSMPELLKNIILSEVNK